MKVVKKGGDTVSSFWFALRSVLVNPSVSEIPGMELWLILFLALSGTARRNRRPDKPNIILILADDLGWNEVSWLVKLEPRVISIQVCYEMLLWLSIFRHNERIKTPNMQVQNYCLFAYLCWESDRSEPLQPRTKTGEILRHTKMFPI